MLKAFGNHSQCQGLHFGHGLAAVSPIAKHAGQGGLLGEPAAVVSRSSSIVKVTRSLYTPIGCPTSDPAASAEAAAAFLKSRGFSAQVVRDVEPGLPIAFVVSDVFMGTVLNFRKHLIHMPRPPKGAA